MNLTEQEEIVAHIQNAGANGIEIKFRGNGTLTPSDLGNESLCLGGYQGIIEYDRSERFLMAKAGTKIAEIRSMLSEYGQKIAFDPPDYAAFFGTKDRGGATIGGVVAGDLSGHGVLYYGSVRDHVLGLSVCSGNGTLYKTGGKTVKNVSGFDITKMMVGSRGRLGAVLTVNLSTIPDMFEVITACFEEPEMSVAANFARKMMRKPYGVTEALYRKNTLYLRMEGYRLNSVIKKFPRQPDRTWHKDEGRSFWENLRDGVCLKEMIAEVAEGMVWQVRTAQTTGAVLLEKFLDTFPKGQGYFEWAGARVWLVVSKTDMEHFKHFIHSIQQQERERISVQAFATPKDLASSFLVQNPKEQEIWRRLQDIHDPHQICKDPLFA